MNPHLGFNLFCWLGSVVDYVWSMIRFVWMIKLSILSFRICLHLIVWRPVTHELPSGFYLCCMLGWIYMFGIFQVTNFLNSRLFVMCL